MTIADQDQPPRCGVRPRISSARPAPCVRRSAGASRSAFFRFSATTERAATPDGGSFAGHALEHRAGAPAHRRGAGRAAGVRHRAGDRRRRHLPDAPWPTRCGRCVRRPARVRGRPGTRNAGARRAARPGRSAARRAQGHDARRRRRGRTVRLCRPHGPGRRRRRGTADSHRRMSRSPGRRAGTAARAIHAGRSRARACCASGSRCWTASRSAGTTSARRS